MAFFPASSQTHIFEILRALIHIQKSSPFFCGKEKLPKIRLLRIRFTRVFLYIFAGRDWKNPAFNPLKKKTEKIKKKHLILISWFQKSTALHSRKASKRISMFFFVRPPDPLAPRNLSGVPRLTEIGRLPQGQSLGNNSRTAEDFFNNQSVDRSTEDKINPWSVVQVKWLTISWEKHVKASCVLC